MSWQQLSPPRFACSKSEQNSGRPAGERVNTCERAQPKERRDLSSAPNRTKLPEHCAARLGRGCCANREQDNGRSTYIGWLSTFGILFGHRVARLSLARLSTRASVATGAPTQRLCGQYVCRAQLVNWLRLIKGVPFDTGARGIYHTTNGPNVLRSPTPQHARYEPQLVPLGVVRVVRVVRVLCARVNERGA